MKRSSQPKGITMKSYTSAPAITETDDQQTASSISFGINSLPRPIATAPETADSGRVCFGAAMRLPASR
jgi:hypothetical protein